MKQVSIFFQSMFSTFLQSIHFNAIVKNELMISPKTERLINASQLEGELYFQCFDLKKTYIQKNDTHFRFITKETQRSRDRIFDSLGEYDYQEAKDQTGFVLIAKNFESQIKRTEDFFQGINSFHSEDFFQSYSKDKIMIEFVGKTKEIDQFKDQIKGLELDLMASQDKAQEMERELNGSILDN